MVDSGQTEGQNLDDLIGIDVRGLAVTRIGLGSIVFIQSMLAGFVPSTAVNHVSSSTTFLAYQMMAVAPFALAFALGFRSRWSNCLCWLIYMVGIRHRLLSGQGTDLANYVLCLFLFWCMFLPTGNKWSVDSYRSKLPQDGPMRYLSVGTAGILLQIFIIYFSAGISKNLQEWFIDGTALQSVLSRDYRATYLGEQLLAFPILLTGLSRAIFVFEIVAPLLLLVPGKKLNYVARLAVIVSFILFHIGLGLTMKLAFFPFISITIWMLFVPSNVWDAVSRSRPPRSATHTLTIEKSAVLNLVCGILIAYVTLSNIVTWTAPTSSVGRRIQAVGLQTCLYQQWVMFNTPSAG